MNSYTKACLEAFPDFLAKRMINYTESLHLSDVDYSEWSKKKLIRGAFRWFESSEGFDFWDSVFSLYELVNQPSIDQIKEVFIKHNIPIE